MRWLYLIWSVAVAATLAQALRETQSTKEYFKSSAFHEQPTLLIGDQPSNTDGNIIMFRGDPQRSGRLSGRLAPSYRESWSVSPFNDGEHTAAKSSPLVDGSVVYAASDMGEVAAFDQSGRRIWHLSVPDSARGFHSTPVIVGDTLYIGDYLGELFAIERHSGKVLWVKDLGDAIGASPLFHDGFLYIVVESELSDGYLVKLDAVRGKLAWSTTSLGAQSHSSPVMNTQGTEIYVGANNGQIFAFDTRAGRLLWKIQTEGAIQGAGLYADGRLFYTNRAGELLAVEASSGRQLWRATLESWSMSSPALITENYIAVADERKLYIYTFAGERIYSWPLEENFQRSSPLVVHEQGGNSIVMACKGRYLCAFDAQSFQGRILATLPAAASSVPALAGDQLYITLDHGPLLQLTRQPRPATASGPIKR